MALLDAFGPGSWRRPEATSFGRMPISTHLLRPEEMSLDGPWAFALRGRPEAVEQDDVAGRTDGWAEIEVPGCWTMQGVRPPAVHERPDAVPRPAAARCPIGQPDRRVPPHGHRARGVGRQAHRAARRPAPRRCCTCTSTATPVGMGKDSRLPHEFDLTDRGRAGPAVRARADRRAVVRRDVPRGPGPLVPRRPPSLGVPVRDAAGAHRRRARRRRLRPGDRRRAPRRARPRRRPTATDPRAGRCRSAVRRPGGDGRRPVRAPDEHRS